MLLDDVAGLMNMQLGGLRHRSSCATEAVLISLEQAVTWASSCCREIPGSISTGWGTWALADASRVLIRHALRDPLNQRFIMVSESCAPLYPPAAVYQQLMYEKKSRINACDSDPDWYRDNYRCAWGGFLHKRLHAVDPGARLLLLPSDRGGDPAG